MGSRTAARSMRLPAERGVEDLHEVHEIGQLGHGGGPR